MKIKIENLLSELTNNINNKKMKTSDIINILIEKFNYKIEEDIVLNDLRTIHFKTTNEINNIKIVSTIIIDKNEDKKKDYVELQYKNKIYKYYFEY